MASSLACTLACYPNHTRLCSYRISDQLCSKKRTLGSKYSQTVFKETENHSIINAIKKSSESKIWRALTCAETHRILGLGVGTATFFTLALAGDAFAVGLESQWESAKALIAQEPKNALSLPTWVIHVSSVVEWMVAMALVWQYGDKPGCQAWKGLSWGMVPLFGGALCACTWHFFYNAESLEILVAMQAALTLVGNFTMLVAAFRIYDSTKGGSET